MKKLKTRWYFLVAMVIVVLLTTLFVRIPIPSRGYFNFGDVAVVFAGLVLGARGGCIAGGLGSALADVIGGFAMFAPLTLVAKGVEGLLCGMARGRSGAAAALLPLAGVLAMAALYFVGETLMPQIGLAGALAEIVPNLIQAAGAYIGGRALFAMYSRMARE
ncbi:ECF transporter S component [Desulforhopalus vacuolatus]|uniref:ECF transporter S component n=1 Tax=Desulforhopalus vacuolatus TaxID=40414 RepID=UPI001966793B|nr:ECF transporter S component [Desulforhopalus vacuolatus]MBM9518582.1 ECF transporter S component [Desulforhopalus vacuolatus]